MNRYLYLYSSKWLSAQARAAVALMAGLGLPLIIAFAVFGLGGFQTAAAATPHTVADCATTTIATFSVANHLEWLLFPAHG